MRLDPRWVKEMQKRGRFGRCCVCQERKAAHVIVIEFAGGHGFHVCSATCAYKLGWESKPALQNDEAREGSA